MGRPDGTGDRYTLIRMLGEGGSGRVWLVEDALRPGAGLAMKELAGSGGDHADRLRREFALLASLHHPNLVEVRDFTLSPESGLPRFTMEYVDGDNLVQAVRREGPDRFLDLAAESLRALRFLHDFKLVHRDLKPGNLLVRRQPLLGCRLVVLDFGLTLRPGDSEKVARLAAGTLPYLAPELFDGAAAGRRSDLYSLGAVLYEAAHGRPPFRHVGEEIAEFIDKVREGRRSRPALPGAFPAGLAGWLEEMLSPDPGGRPASAVDALARLNDTCGCRFPMDTPAGRLARLRSGMPEERGEEIGRIRACLDPASGSRLVWLCGEPGSGKTRLLRWLESEAILDGREVVLLSPDTPGAEEIVRHRTRNLSNGDTGDSSLVLLDGAESCGGRTAAWLDRIARASDRPPVQIVATVQSGRIANPVLARLFSDTGTVPTMQRVDLRRLDAAGALTMARRAAGGATLPLTLGEKLLQASEGLPRSAESLLVRGDWERWEQQTGGGDHQGATEGWMEVLSPDALAWFRCLAVLGGGSPAPALLEFSGMPPARFRTAADEVVLAGLARREGDRWSPESRSIPERMIEALEPGARRELHRKGARVLLRCEGDAADPWALHRLWLGAGQSVEAAGCAVRAARLSRNEGDPAEAASRFAQALRIVDRRDPRRHGLRLEMGDALMEAGLYRAAARSYGAALALAGDGRRRAETLTRQARALVEAGRFRRAYRTAEEALELASGLDIPEETARARMITGIVLGRLAREEQAIPVLEEALGSVSEPGAEGDIHQALGACRLRLGLSRAEDDFRLAIERFRAAGLTGKELRSRIGLGILRSRAREHEEARSILEGVREAASEQGNLVLLESALSRLAAVAIDQGRLDTAMERTGEAAGLARHLGNRNLVFTNSCHLADARIRCGRPGEAAALLRETLDAPHEQVEPEILDYTRMLLADALMEASGSEDGEIRALLERSLAGCRQRRKRRAWLMALVIEMERRACQGCEDRFEPVRMEYDAVMRSSAEPVEAEIRFRAELALATFQISRGNPEGARLAAENAASIAAECGAPAFGARAQALLHDALRRLQRTGEATRALEEGRRLLEEAAGRIRSESIRDDFLSRPVFRLLRREDPPADRAAESRLEALYDMIRALNSETDPDALLESILDMALRVVRAERGMILLKDRATEEFSVRLARNLEAETAADAEAYSRSIVAEAGAGRSLIALDAGNDARFRDLASVSLYRIRSLMCVPLRSRGRIIGTVYLDSRKEGVLFHKDDLRFLEAFADQAALALENVRSRADLERENRRLQTIAETRVRFGNLVGRSPGMQKVFDLIEKVAETELPVLIHGESGTGKELVARAIHFHGPRRRSIFLTENCAAIPESLLESELFGHVRGAFTGADRDRPGLFEQAHAGTLFLDEIGDMSPGMQARLLRVLQEGELRRVGGEESIRVDVRVVAATHRDLPREVEAGRFREDLLYRLQVLTLDLPPLRDRPGDVVLLCDHILDRIAAERGRDRPVLEDEVIDLLERHTWPGNIRELENALQRLTVLAGRGPITADTVDSDPGLRTTLRRSGEVKGVRLSLEHGERAQIRRALDAVGGNRNRAARLLGVSRATLYRKLKRHRLH